MQQCKFLLYESPFKTWKKHNTKKIDKAPHNLIKKSPHLKIEEKKVCLKLIIRQNQIFSSLVENDPYWNFPTISFEPFPYLVGQ